MIRKILLAVCLVLLVFSFIGCKTIQGLGHDITSAGEAAEDIVD